MRRVPHGATRAPAPARPANGYGRKVRPGPDPYRGARLLASEPAPLAVDDLLVEASTVGDDQTR